jgi:hypothetical protein
MIDNMAPPPAERLSFFNVMLKAYTRPSTANFRSLARNPDASVGKAYLWIAIAAVISSIISTLVMQLFPTYRLWDALNQYGGDFGLNIDIPPQSGGLAIITSLLCGVPLAAIFGVIGFAIVSGLLHLIAGLLGGKGDYGRLAYMLAAVSVPFSILSSLITPIPYLGCLAFLLSLYIIVLEVLAIDGVYQFGVGKAIITLLIPLIAIFLLAFCLAAGIVAILIPIIRENTLLWLELGRGLLPAV